jgi:GNAT superfamily N-acetyltransferase
MSTISAPKVQDTQKLLDIAVSTGLFTPAEAEDLLGQVLSDYFNEKLGQGHRIFAIYDAASEEPAGWTYFAPTPHAPGVYDVWWIGIIKAQHGKGLGTQLLHFIEANVTQHDAEARMVIIETSSRPEFAPTRAFYRKRGYKQCGEIPNFYDIEDNKIIFAKELHT